MQVYCTGGPHFHKRVPQNPVKMGTQGSLKYYYENGDLGPHFHMTPTMSPDPFFFLGVVSGAKRRDSKITSTCISVNRAANGEAHVH